MEGARDELGLAHLTDTDAKISLARGELELAAGLAADAVARAEHTGSQKGIVDALLTQARVARRRGDPAAALAALERAESAAVDGPTARLKAVLTERAEVLAEGGDHAAAWELSKRALALG
jgi:ATP/maltotriose-dependent transcriptional regulator MalT